MCHGGDVRALPADLFMIWLLISFTGTWESASQIGLRAPLCAHVLAHAWLRGREKPNALQYAHECVCFSMCLYLCACACNYICVQGFLIFLWEMKSWQIVCGKVCLFQWRGGPRDECPQYNRVVIDLSDNSRKSLCNWRWRAMGADSNLFRSIGCGEECGGRCLVSVVGGCVVSQRVCSLVCVCVFFIWFIAIFVGTCLTVTVAKPLNACGDGRKPAANEKLS